MNFLIFLASLLISLSVEAHLQVGSGFNSATGGRLVPSLNLGFGNDSFAVLGSSTGVATKAYSHSAYSLSGYWTKKAGDFLWGDLVAGFGAGAFYAQRTFKDTNTPEETKSDFALGPAFFSQWRLLSPMYISVEGICGFGGSGSASGQIFGLSYRDHVNFIFGVEL
jgi:hypothetical protein